MVWEIEAEETRMLERGQRRFAEADDIAWMAAKALNDGTLNGEPALTLDAIRLAEQAIEKDRNCRMAWYVLSSCHTTRVFYTWTQDRLGSIAAARRAATELMILAPGDSRSYFVRGRIETIAGDFGRGVADLRRASQLNPNDPLVLFYLSWNEAADGNFERAKDLAAQAIRISPKDRFIGAAYLACAMAEFIAQDFCAMRHWAELAIQANPSAPIRRVMMIVYASEAGDTTLLNLHLERLRSISPGFLPTLFRGDYLAFQRPEHMRTLLNSLHKAGLGADATAGDGAASIPNAPFSE